MKEEINKDEILKIIKRQMIAYLFLLITTGGAFIYGRFFSNINYNEFINLPKNVLGKADKSLVEQGIKVGDYVNYDATSGKGAGLSYTVDTKKSGSTEEAETFNSSDITKWRVLSVKNGTITITDMVGNTRDCSVNAYVDKTAPSCGNVSGASTTWTKNNRDITVACSDGHSGCAASSYKKTFSSTTKTGTITVKDNAGNVKDCTVNAYVDKNAPTCGSISGGSTSWTSGDRNITVNCNDTGSGCSAVQKKYTSTKKTDSVQIKDGAGNTANCSVNVYVDKTAPSCNGVWGDSTSWTNGDRSIGVGCSDSDSRCGQGSYSRYFNWTTRTDNVTIYDNAGNSRNCGVNVYVDKTPPSVWTSEGPWGQKCNGYKGLHAVYEVREYESGLAFVGDWWGWDWDFNGANALNRNVGWGTDSFTKIHNWSAGCTVKNQPGGYCYRIKVLARDIAGNEAHFVSPDCAYKA